MSSLTQRLPPWEPGYATGSTVWLFDVCGVGPGSYIPEWRVAEKRFSLI